MGTLVSTCLLPEVGAVDTLSISRPAELGSLDPVVFSALRDSLGIAVVLTDIVPTDGPRLLRFDLESAIVDLRRSGKQIDRLVTVSVPYVVTGERGLVLESGTCTQSARDIIDRGFANSLASSPTPLPMQVRPVPARGFLRRFVGPAVTVGAATVSLYLLFNLRSDRQNASQ